MHTVWELLFIAQLPCIRNYHGKNAALANKDFFENMQSSTVVSFTVSITLRMVVGPKLPRPGAMREKSRRMCQVACCQ